MKTNQNEKKTKWKDAKRKQNLGFRRVSGITYSVYTQGQKVRKPIKYKVFRNNNIKGTKQDSQNQLRLHLPEGYRPFF
jgi:hypothetical protein